MRRRAAIMAEFSNKTIQEVIALEMQMKDLEKKLPSLRGEEIIEAFNSLEEIDKQLSVIYKG